MKNYEILEHTADLKIRAYGENLEKVFSNFLKAMVEVCQPEIDSSSLISRKIQIKAESLESLLIDFLSEIIYLMDVNKEIYTRAELMIKGNKLKGEIKGQKVKRFQTEIKAATWHDLKIEKKDNLWTATVLFDI
ncbi:archease [Patescibacteria group bacterium]|nr:archease [Patescibacteria group bacterium]